MTSCACNTGRFGLRAMFTTDHGRSRGAAASASAWLRKYRAHDLRSAFQVTSAHGGGDDLRLHSAKARSEAASKIQRPAEFFWAMIDFVRQACLSSSRVRPYCAAASGKVITSAHGDATAVDRRRFRASHRATRWRRRRALWRLEVKACPSSVASGVGQLLVAALARPLPVSLLGGARFSCSSRWRGSVNFKAQLRHAHRQPAKLGGAAGGKG